MKLDVGENADNEIDVVVVNYNAGNYITSLIEALKVDHSLKIQVVDNGSSDGSVQATIDLGITPIQNNENLGFAAACNQGAAKGTAPLIAFVNPDCVLYAEQIKHLAQHVSGESEFALAGCHVVNIDGSPQRGTWRRLPTFWRVLLTYTRAERLPFIQGLNLKSAPDDKLYNKLKTNQVEAVNGACYVIKRPVFESLSGFDEAFPLHFEDLDLYARLIKSGHKLTYLNDIRIKHVKGYSGKDSQQIKHWKKTGLLRYFRKHRPAWEAKIIAFLVGLK